MSKKDKKAEIIRIGAKAGKQVEVGLRQAEAFNIYLSGIRAALNVPDDWQFGAREMGFVPPKEKKE